MYDSLDNEYKYGKSLIFIVQVEKEREAEEKASLENKGEQLRKALNDISQAVSPEVATVTFQSTKPKRKPVGKK